MPPRDQKAAGEPLGKDESIGRFHRRMQDHRDAGPLWSRERLIEHYGIHVPVPPASRFYQVWASHLICQAQRQLVNEAA